MSPRYEDSLITTIASHPSRCEVCEELVEEGQEIALLEEDGAWVHVNCAENA